jgi:hypothetical protein
MSTNSLSDGPRDKFNRFRLWFGLLGGALAWLTHFMIAYGVAEFGCVGNLGSYTALGISLVAWVVLVMSAVTLAIAVLASLTAYRTSNRLVAMKNEGSGTAFEAELYTAKAGWITSGLFALVIVVETLPIFYFLQDC